MARFFHAHKVSPDKCRGHMSCMRACPTQAIRIRNRRASISEELCVDCGACIPVCPEGAIEPIVDPVSEIAQFKYKVVIPSPVLYTQFGPDTHPYLIHMALKKAGFDEVVDVSSSAPALTHALKRYMENHAGRLPLISPYCPSIVRLIQVKYPDLVELIIPLDAPKEVTAREIRKRLIAEKGLKSEDIGIVYLASCPAKIVSIKQPAEKARSYLDSGVSILDAYSVLHPKVVAFKEEFTLSQVPDDFTFDSGWAGTGSIVTSTKMENWLAVSGIENCKQILDDIEKSRLRNVDFVELRAHLLGCIGGPYLVENPYVARANNIKQRERYQKAVPIDEEDIERKLAGGYYFTENAVLPRPITYLDTDLATSIRRMKEIEKLYSKLPQIDCGCCGSPTCRAFAEDFVRGEVGLTSCIYLSESHQSDRDDRIQ